MTMPEVKCGGNISKTNMAKIYMHTHNRFVCTYHHSSNMSMCLKEEISNKTYNDEYTMLYSISVLIISLEIIFNAYIHK